MPHRVWDLGYLGTYSRDRQPALERLLIEPARRLPHRALRRRRSAISRRRSTGPPMSSASSICRRRSAPSFYSRQRFTLNVTRADMIAAGWSPSVRLFEAAACGTPIISDVWEGLETLFPPGEAIVLARDTQDVIMALQNTTGAQRDALAAAARWRVLARHTSTARAAELITMLALDGQPPRIAVQKG